VSEGKIANGAVSRAKLTADAQLPAVVVRRSAVVDVPGGSGAIGTATASCQPGERATGGGVLPVSGPTSLVLAVGDGPVPGGDGNVPAGWQGFVRNGDMGTAQMVAYAICARAG
jgi:hypothetical protein